MNETFNISVIIPTYQRKDKVISAIESVLAQTYLPLEIIVVDDGSTDGTEHVLRERYKDRIRVIRQRHRGVSAARNRGVREATGEWIAFLDSDDVWHKDKLEKQTDFIRQNPNTEIVQTDEIWIRNGRRVNPMNKHRKYDGTIFEQCLPLCIVTPSSVLMKKALFERVDGFDVRLPACEDYDLWLRIAKDTPIRLISDKLVTRYGGHDDQLSARYWGMDRFRVQALLKLLQNGLSDDQRQLVCNELQRKASILSQGAWKRHHYFQAIHYYLIFWLHSKKQMKGL